MSSLSLEPEEPTLDPEPILGWRLWQLERNEGGLQLVSLTRPSQWPAGRPMRAACHAHPAPQARCSCGLYATAGPEDLPLAGVFAPSIGVVGAIAMWGTVVEHASGARSAFAYPARLRLVCGPCLATGRGAVQPFAVLEGDSLVPVCRWHRFTQRGRRFSAREVQSELLDTYAVELLPLERVRTALKKPWAVGVSRGGLTSIVEGVFQVFGLVYNAVMTFLIVVTIASVLWTIVGGIRGVLFGK